MSLWIWVQQQKQFVEVVSTVRTRQLKCYVRILANVQPGLSDLGSVIIVTEKLMAARWRSTETASEAPTPVALWRFSECRQQAWAGEHGEFVMSVWSRGSSNRNTVLEISSWIDFKIYMLSNLVIFVSNFRCNGTGKRLHESFKWCARFIALHISLITLKKVYKNWITHQRHKSSKSLLHASQLRDLSISRGTFDWGVGGPGTWTWRLPDRNTVVSLVLHQGFLPWRASRWQAACLPARIWNCNAIQQNRGQNNQNLISQSHTFETLRGNPPRNESIQVVRFCVYMSICSITLFPNGTLCFVPQRWKHMNLAAKRVLDETARWCTFGLMPWSTTWAEWMV